MKLYSSRQFYLSSINRINKTLKNLTLTEKVILSFLSGLMTITTLIILFQINQHFLIEIPARGGELKEGVVGSPRFINPLITVSNTDRDITALIYSGLLKATPNGQLENDLAEKYSVSEDGLIYTFKLKDKIFFHDNQPITTDDIEFTIKLTQNNVIKSPKRPNWDGIKIEKINDKEIKFILKTPYSPFLENTTLGILPKHIWGEILPEEFAFSQLNIEPIGSGPYKLKGVKRNASGIVESYQLTSFSKYALGEPFITNLTINFYPNEEKLMTAFLQKDIEAINSISPESATKIEEKGIKIEKISLPRIFAVFFNQNKNQIFTYKEVRDVLDKTLDRNKIIQETLGGYGKEIFGPVPLTSQYFNSSQKQNLMSSERAVEILENNGWKLNKNGYREKTIKKIKVPLEFTITTSDAPELKAVANIVKTEWEKLGFKIKLNIYEIGDLNQNIIRPRNYDALLFGEIIGRDMDLFAFWHSSQRNDPGLNIAMYANIKVDKLLEKVRTSNNEKERIVGYNDIQKEIGNDVPAVFIYSPDFIYIIPNKIKNLKLNQIAMPSERFINIYQWHINTESVWPIFSK